MKNIFSKSAALLAVSVVIAAGFVTFFDLWDRLSSLFRPSNAAFTSSMLCTWDPCLEDNRRFIEFLEANHGKTVMVDFQIDIPIGIGEFQSACYGELVHTDSHDGEDSMIIAVLPSFDECFPPGAVFLKVETEYTTHVTAVTGNYKDRVFGNYVVTLGSIGGATMYTLVRLSI